MRTSVVLGLLLLVAHGGDRAAPTAPARGEAVGRIADCTGTLVAPDVVLTARHCHVRTTDVFCPGKATRQAPCVAITKVADHPDLDLTVVTLGADRRLASIAPIAVFDERLDERWVGRDVEWAGVGERADGRRGRAFVRDAIAGIDGKYIFIGAAGRRGACFGDSGGPVFVTDRRGAPRVAGVLHAGDPDCRGSDEYTRVDQAGDWLRARLPHSTPSGGAE